MRLQETRQIDRPLEEVFAFTADFANAEKWDPGVSSSRRVGNGPVGVGSRYDVMVSFGSRELPMTYEVTEWEPNARVVLVGSGETIEAMDEIRFEAHGGGTVVHYVADLNFTNWIRFLGPLMAPLLVRVGRRALDGLVETLDR